MLITFTETKSVPVTKARVTRLVDAGIQGFQGGDKDAVEAIRDELVRRRNKTKGGTHSHKLYELLAPTFEAMAHAMPSAD